jgi:hypothetical protein
MPIVTIGGLPVFQARVTDEETGMLRISLVEDPAVQSYFQAFDAARRIQLYAVSNEERRLVLGVVMRADFPIYRRDAWGEYYVIYHADEIRRMAEKYLLEGRQNNVNLMHEEGTDTDGVQMVQYFIKGKGVNPDGFDDIPDGSLFAEFHVTDDVIWAAIKDGTYKGFSLEGYFDLVPEEDVEGVRQIVRDLDGNFSNTPTNDNNMAKLQKIRAGLARLLAQLGNVTTDRGILAWDGDEDLKAGDRVYIEDLDGNRTDAADGDYRTEDGKVIVVVNSQVAEIRDPEAEVAPQPEEAPAAEEEAARVEYGRVVTEDGDLLYEGEDDLAAGTPVFVETEDGVAPAPDGEYRTADGKVIRVADGVVAEIIDPEAEVAPVDDRDEQIEALRRENEDLRAQLEQLQRTPAAQPAREVVKNASAEIRQTGVKGLDRLAALMAKN